MTEQSYNQDNESKKEINEVSGLIKLRNVLDNDVITQFWTITGDVTKSPDCLFSYNWVL